ncbi:ABC-type branched-subunit amino acid transport system substrate-binding protein [Bradyrhizobium sp. i1.4.4]
MKHILSGIFAAAFALSASAAAQAQDKPPLKIGGILDMSSLYADITGPGSETAAKMAVEDFGGEVLGRKIQVLAADHLNKADLSANIARDMLDNQGVEMIYDVAASATALAAGEIAKARNKIIMFNGPGSIRLTNEACGPYTIHYVFDTYGQANVTGLAAVKSGLDSWFFLTADYAFGQDLEKDTSAVVTKTGGKVLGAVRHPLNTSDFSSFLLQAQASKAKVIGLANAGGDTVNAIKQAAEFGITKGAARRSRRCSPSSPTSIRSGWRPRRACCSPKPSTGTSTTTRARSRSDSWSAPSAYRPRRRPASIRRSRIT